MRYQPTVKTLLKTAGKPKHAFSPPVKLHLAELAERFSYDVPQSQARSFASSRSLRNPGARNRVQTSIRRPPDFHTLLQSASSTNTLLLALFTTSTCQSCVHITPLLKSIVQSRPQPSIGDRYSSIAFAELELDSPERDEGGGIGWVTMYDVGIEHGIRSVPTLIGFGGRRAERVTDRLADENKLKDEVYMAQWIDEQMKKGDPHPNEGRGLFSRIFSGGS